ncbi:MAG: GtrA family protein [Thermogutta sp.]
MQIKILVPTKITSADSVVGQFLRYLVVGGVAFLVDFGVLVLLTEVLRLYYLASAAIAFWCGLVTNYVLSITWVFSTRALASKRTEFTIFLIIGVVGLGWNELLLYLGTDVLGVDYRLSKLITVAIVLFWNFGMRKLILFSGPTK